MNGVTLPRPFPGRWVVTTDPRERALVARPAADASATVKVLWRDGVRAQARDALTVRTVWAAGAGKLVST